MTAWCNARGSVRSSASHNAPCIDVEAVGNRRGGATAGTYTYTCTYAPGHESGRAGRTPLTCAGSSDENSKRRGTGSQTHASVLTRPVAKKEKGRKTERKEALNPCDKVQEKKVPWVVTDRRKMSSGSCDVINLLPAAKRGEMSVSQIRQEMGCSSWLIKRVYLLDQSANCAKAAKR